MKKEMQDALEVAKDKVHTSFPSLYSRQDVLTLLEQIQIHVDSIEVAESEAEPVLTERFIEQVISKVSSFIRSAARSIDDDDVVDKDSAEFELHGNEISLYHVDVDTTPIADTICDEVEESLREYLTEVATPAETQI